MILDKKKCFYIHVNIRILGDKAMGVYCTLFNQTGTSGSTAIFTASRGGGESAGSVARSESSVSAFANHGGGESAGSVASSSSGSSCCSCSFTAIA